MAFNTKISNAGSIAAVNALTALLDVGGAGTVQIYDGAQPADVSVAVTGQVLLATLPLSATAFLPAVDNAGSGRATANAITTDTGAQAGTATWFRAFSGGGLAVIDGEAGLNGSSSDMELDDVTFEAGDDISITLWTVTLPE